MSLMDYDMTMFTVNTKTNEVKPFLSEFNADGLKFRISKDALHVCCAKLWNKKGKYVYPIIKVIDSSYKSYACVKLFDSITIDIKHLASGRMAYIINCKNIICIAIGGYGIYDNTLDILNKLKDDGKTDVTELLKDKNWKFMQGESYNNGVKVSNIIACHNFKTEEHIEINHNYDYSDFYEGITGKDISEVKEHLWFILGIDGLLLNINGIRRCNQFDLIRAIHGKKDFMKYTTEVDNLMNITQVVTGVSMVGENLC